MPAQAQRARVFVASYGNDSNPCSFGSPCRTFQAAHDAVAANGEITAIDSAGFGPVIISKAVTITSPPGIEASIAAAAGLSAIAVAAGANDVVTLRGLTLNGGGSGGYGINFTAGAKLAVIDCVISNYTQYGILVQASAIVQVLVSNTVVTDNGQGIQLITLNGFGLITGSFGGLVVDNNTNGMALVADAGPIEAVIANSQFGQNSAIGIYSRNSGGTHNRVFLKNVTFNPTGKVFYWDGASDLYLSQIVEAGQGDGVNCTNNANTVYSDGTNHLNPINPPCAQFSWTPN
jgi:hypothetical protein